MYIFKQYLDPDYTFYFFLKCAFLHGSHIGIECDGHLEKYTVCNINVPIRNSNQIYFSEI
jgi:hypothetical protein